MVVATNVAIFFAYFNLGFFTLSVLLGNKSNTVLLKALQLPDQCCSRTLL